MQSFHEPLARPIFQSEAPDDPQNLNRYAYVRNNPLRYVDPTGYWTFGFGLGGTIGAGGGISGSIMIVFDGNGNIGIAISGGGGGYAGIGASGGLIFQGTSADDISLLNGVSVQTGGSATLLGLNVSPEWVIMNGPSGPIQGGNFTVGAGTPFPPFELHSIVEGTRVTSTCPPWKIDWSDYPIPTSD